MNITYTLDSPEIKTLCASDKKLSILIKRYGNLTYTLYADEFAFIVETIIGQMLSSKAAEKIVSRMYDLCENRLTIESVLRISHQDLRGIGLSGKKADYILQFAQTVQNDPELFARLRKAPDCDVIKQLTALRGIGIWTAKMYLIFVLDRHDILPCEDGAFLQAYKWLYGTNNINPAAIEQQCLPWQPYSSIAARYLYRALDEGLMQDAEFERKLQESGA